MCCEVLIDVICPCDCCVVEIRDVTGIVVVGNIDRGNVLIVSKRVASFALGSTVGKVVADTFLSVGGATVFVGVKVSPGCSVGSSTLVSSAESTLGVDTMLADMTECAFRDSSNCSLSV